MSVAAPQCFVCQLAGVGDRLVWRLDVTALLFCSPSQRFKFQVQNPAKVTYGITVTLPIRGGLHVIAAER